MHAVGLKYTHSICSEADMSMKVKQIFNSGVINSVDEETGESKLFYKYSAYVSGETGFMHTFVSDKAVKVGDEVKFPEWVLSENVHVDRTGKVQINLVCEPECENEKVHLSKVK